MTTEEIAQSPGVCAPETPCEGCLGNEAAHYLNYVGCTLASDGGPCGTCRGADRLLIKEIARHNTDGTIADALNAVGPVQLAADLRIHIHGMKLYINHIGLRWENDQYALPS